MPKKFIKKLRENIKEVLTIKESPGEIASGFALATVIALLPTFGVGIFIGLGILLVFKKISKISMICGFAFWNPIITMPFYTLSYIIGDLIYLSAPGFNFRFEVREQLYIYSIKFLLGNVLLVIFIGIVSYFVIKAIAKKYQG